MGRVRLWSRWQVYFRNPIEAITNPIPLNSAMIWRYNILQSAARQVITFYIAISARLGQP